MSGYPNFYVASAPNGEIEQQALVCAGCDRVLVQVASSVIALDVVLATAQRHDCRGGGRFETAPCVHENVEVREATAPEGTPLSRTEMCSDCGAVLQ